jgi:hypothetical protein
MPHKRIHRCHPRKNRTRSTTLNDVGQAPRRKWKQKSGGDASTRKRGGLTADLDGRVDSEEVGLGEEHPLAVDAELADLRLRELHLAPAAAALHEPPRHLVHRRAIHRPHRGPRHHHLPRCRQRAAEEEMGGETRRGRVCVCVCADLSVWNGVDDQSTNRTDRSKAREPRFAVRFVMDGR